MTSFWISGLVYTFSFLFNHCFKFGSDSAFISNSWVSNREQATFVIRIVTEDFKVHEEFLGLYEVPSIDSKTLVDMIKDILVRLNININKVRGQCYDGASAMRGHKSGVSTIISQIEPRALYTHCYGHSLNIAASDSLNKSKVMKEALQTTHEIVKLIKFSPRRDNIFRKIKEDMTPGSREFSVLHDGQ